MIASVNLSVSQWLVLIAIAIIVFSSAIGYKMYRDGDRAGIVTLLIGMPGLYLSACGAFTQRTWIFVLGGILVAAAYGYQFRLLRQRKAGSSDDQ